MSSATDADVTPDELLEMMQGDPREVLRDNQDLLAEMRDETDSDVLTEYIDGLLEEFDAEDSGPGDRSR